MSDPSGTQIMVTEDLADCGTYLMGIANQINDQLTTLKNQLALTHQDWIGNASESWQALQAQWDAAAANLMTGAGELGAISHAATVNWSNYVDCETSNTSSWQT